MVIKFIFIVSLVVFNILFHKALSKKRIFIIKIFKENEFFVNECDLDDEQTDTKSSSFSNLISSITNRRNQINSPIFFAARKYRNLELIGSFFLAIYAGFGFFLIF